MARPTYGCDWTEYQGPLMPERLRDEGFRYCWLKAGGSGGRGTFFADPVFRQNARSLARVPEVVPGAFWYLSPGQPRAQAGAFLDAMVDAVGGWRGWMLKLDAEKVGLTARDVFDFARAISYMTNGYPLVMYTRRTFWQDNSLGDGFSLTPLLEDAHWVPAEVRNDLTQPYLSQQAHHVPDGWWQPQYGNWPNAFMLQISDRVLVDQHWTTGSISKATPLDLRRMATL